MICPYRKSIHLYEITTEEDGKTTHEYREDYMYEICVKEQCGAWHRDKCEYREK